MTGDLLKSLNTTHGQNHHLRLWCKEMDLVACPHRVLRIEKGLCINVAHFEVDL
jgi:hypothetical protein